MFSSVLGEEIHLRRKEFIGKRTAPFPKTIQKQKRTFQRSSRLEVLPLDEVRGIATHVHPWRTRRGREKFNCKGDFSHDLKKKEEMRGKRGGGGEGDGEGGGKS